MYKMRCGLEKSGDKAVTLLRKRWWSGPALLAMRMESIGEIWGM
jgi:hypothetical protein